MADQPEEMKNSIPWFWLLGLLLAFLAGWYAIVQLGDEDAAADQAVADASDPSEDPYARIAAENDAAYASAQRANAAGAITGIAGLSGLAELIGRRVELDGVAVTQVVDDEAFTIGEGDSEVLVMFTEEATPQTLQEGSVDVNPGSRVSFAGTIQSVEDLPASVANEIAGGTQAYIQTDTVTVAE